MSEQTKEEKSATEPLNTPPPTEAPTELGHNVPPTQGLPPTYPVVLEPPPEEVPPARKIRDEEPG
jgi:hypothetical protein